MRQVAIRKYATLIAVRLAATLLFFIQCIPPLHAQIEPGKIGNDNVLFESSQTVRETSEILSGENAIGQSGTLVAADGAASDQFGYSVAVSGTTVVIGVPFSNTSNQGAAYVYIRQPNGTWQLQQKLVHSDSGTGSDIFGISVAIENDTIAVGASARTVTFGGQGAVYVFKRSGGVWTEQQRLLASDPALDDQFGISVDISGNTVLIGAFRDDSGSENSGSVYIFTENVGVWSQQQKIANPNPASNEECGISVGIDGDTIVFGCHFQTVSVSQQGSAYVFTRNGSIWSQQSRLTASTPKVQGHFGFSVGISGNSIVVGAYNDDAGVNFSGRGAAFVFVRIAGVWSEQQKLTAFSGGSNGDEFGNSVAIDGNRIIVGSHYDDLSQSVQDSGAAYIFERNTSNIWQTKNKLRPNDAELNGNFGISVAIDDVVMLVGANLDDSSFLDQGAAYIFINLTSNWVWESHRVVSDGAEGDQFGSKVAISGNWAIATAEEFPFTGLWSGAVYVFNKTASGWTQTQRIANPNGANSRDLFGFSLAIEGDTMIIGSPWENLSFDRQGSAYVYVRNGSTWELQQKITASDGQLDDLFGYSVAISGETVAIGAVRDVVLSGSGSCYVFTRSGTNWTQQVKVFPNDNGASFGGSVAIDGNLLVVGSTEQTAPDPQLGSIYIYTRNNFGAWAFQQRIFAADGMPFDLFSYSVAVSGNTIAVGARNDDETFMDQGSVYIFTGGGSVWNQQQKLLASTTAGDDEEFGFSLSLDGDTLVVGQFGYVANQGQAFVYERENSNWTEKKILMANPVESGAAFGLAVGIDGDKIIVGSPFSDLSANSFQSVSSIVPNATNQGAVHFFINNPFAPTAAQASISGRVTTADGRGIGNATIILTDNAGHVRIARSSTFGYYRFDEIEVGESYILQAVSKRYTFENATRFINFNDELTNEDFVSILEMNGRSQY